MKTIGITTTVPIEILLAAGYKPVDLNNIFVNAADRTRLVTMAEQDGYPQNLCTWIKGLYSSALQKGIDTVLGVTTGDCSNTEMLMDVLALKGVDVLPFAYPHRPNVTEMQEKLALLAAVLGTNLKKAEEIRQNLAAARAAVHELDRMTWQDGTVTGGENHYWLVSSSDFNGDPEQYRQDVEALITEARTREPIGDDYLRLAFIGVPPIFAEDFYRFLEQHQARVVFNEVQRQFSMPHPAKNLAEQYSNYTYPYSVFDRLRDIVTELDRRRVDGVIHYVQAFCHRGIADIIMRDKISHPMLTLEGNNDFVLTTNVQTRLEAFLDMIRRRIAAAR
jgi:benzoyl-CoA reductase/2-hydroxyglutaryl-CoA dehydratase subunit BcrC/BadD/HgdB